MTASPISHAIFFISPNLSYPSFIFIKIFIGFILLLGSIERNKEKLLSGCIGYSIISNIEYVITVTRLFEHIYVFTAKSIKIFHVYLTPRLQNRLMNTLDPIHVAVFIHTLVQRTVAKNTLDGGHLKPLAGTGLVSRLFK